MAERAARLCKADLVTGMVGEFPELQGIMGGYYARAQGEPDAVADAIRDHYKPVGQGDDVPTAPVTVAVSLADKLDTLLSFFKVNLLPTGSKDPFALRRAGLGYLRLIQQNELRLHLQSVAQFWGGPSDGIQGLRLADFLFDRLGVQLKDEGVRHDFIQASRAWGFGSDTDGCIDRVEARARALTAFVATQEGADLLAGYKRAANILKSSPTGGGGPAKLVEGHVPDDTDPQAATPVPLHQPAALRQAQDPSPRSGEELALLTALNTAEPLAAAAIEAEDFEGAMTALASLRAPIDAFFDGVMVIDPDADKRAYRLGLLTRFRDAVHRVADFSRIEG
jgi:glycyl-tRNA synthetase beta chain